MAEIYKLSSLRWDTQAVWTESWLMLPASSSPKSLQYSYYRLRDELKSLETGYGELVGPGLEKPGVWKCGRDFVSEEQEEIVKSRLSLLRKCGDVIIIMFGY